MNTEILNVPSPVQKVEFCGFPLFVKRDDKISTFFSGNKARKFWHYFSTDFSGKNKIISFGGNQSNAMLSLAAFAQLKHLEFEYYLKPLPKFLIENPSGNFKQAIKLGMKYVETQTFGAIKPAETALFIQQGGAQKEAEEGIKLLAKEIDDFANKHNIKDLAIVLPSGTGTTALYLNKNSKFRVITMPVAGDSTYLKKQFLELESNTEFFPEIIDTPKKYAFGKLYPEYYYAWKNACEQTKITFELLYDPKAFLLLEEILKSTTSPVLYIHQGGTFGNETMLARYKRFFYNLKT